MRSRSLTVTTQTSFTLDVQIYPDFGSVHLRKRPYLVADPKNTPQEEMQLQIYELEAFAAGIIEAVTIAKERGFIP